MFNGPGRHSTSGDNSSDGGLVIDLRRMRSVSVNVAEKTVKAGGGCVWLDVDSALAAHGLSVVGGTVNQTGIGGLTLGGGYGWLSGQQGLTLDRLIAAEVVLANGSIITTSATEEPDLFWALRGAGQSFGVVTSFTFQASDQLNTVYGGMLAWPATSEVIRHVLDFANAIAKGDDARAGILVGFNSPPPMAGKLAVIAACFLDARHEEGEAFYSPLLNIEPFMNTLTLMPYETMNSLFNQTAAINGGRRIQKGGSFQPPLPAEAFERAINKFEDVCDKVPNMKAQSMCLFEFYPPHAICAVGETDTAFGNRGTHQNLMASLKWDDDSFDAIARTGAAEIVNASKDIVKKDGKETGEYLNYDGKKLNHSIPSSFRYFYSSICRE